MDFLEFIWLYVLVFLLGAVPFLEAYAVIPISIIAGLSPIPALLLGLLGNIITILLVILFVEKIKDWRNKGKKKETDEEHDESKRSRRAQKIWKKYGLPGLAMVGPLIVGSHLTAFMSISLGGTKKKSLYWVTLSIIIWTVVFTALASFGVDFLGRGNEGILRDIFGN